MGDGAVTSLALPFLAGIGVWLWSRRRRHTAPATADAKPRITIDNAMKLVEKDYAAANPRK